MRYHLHIKVFGQAKIYLNQTEIHFSFSKINALIYYLLIKQTTSREELATLLWENKDTQTAKKNLRNTIYQANKVLGQDVILSPNRNLVSLNPHLQITSDWQKFVQDPYQELSLYHGLFLEGFYVKGGKEFDFWIDEMRQYAEQLFVTASYQKVNHASENQSFEEKERLLLSLIKVDGFDEQNYLLLMQLYQKHQKHQKINKLIDIYYRLVNLLDKELGVSPCSSIQELYDETIAKDRHQRKIESFFRNTYHFFGRSKEIRQIENYLMTRDNEQAPRALLLVGGTGIGKRTVTRQVLANQTERCHILTTECQADSQQFPLKPWLSILEGLRDIMVKEKILTLQAWQNEFSSLLIDAPLQLNYSDALNQILQFLPKRLKQLHQHKPLIIVIEDCHWLDQISTSIFSQLIKNLDLSGIAFILTKHLSTPDYLEECLNQLYMTHQLTTISLGPLNKKESQACLKALVGKKTVAQEDFEKIFYLSQGNPFLLSEYAYTFKREGKIHPLTPAIRAKFAAKIHQLNEKETALFDYLSCHEDPLKLSDMTHLLSLSQEETTLLVDRLIHQNLLKEFDKEGTLYIDFTEKIVRYYYYERLSLSKKRLLHGQLAQLFSTMLTQVPPTPKQLQTIAHHYQLAGQTVAYLRYQIYYFETILPLQHELFPIYAKAFPLSDYDEKEQNISKQLQSLKTELYLLKNQANQEELEDLLMRFFYLEGRYLIRTGCYTDGIQSIKKVIQSAQELENPSYLFHGYRQLIYYCVQTDQIEDMYHYVELALEAAVKDNNFEAIAIHLRLKGLYDLIAGHETQAIKCFEEALTCFTLTTSLTEKYALQIAATLDYLGEIAAINQDYERALTLHHKAQTLAQEQAQKITVALFEISTGIDYYWKKDFTKAEELFLKAKSALDHVNFPWKETQLEVHLALIYCEKQYYHMVNELIDKKDQLIARYSNPRDKGLIAYFLAYLAYLIQSHQMDDPQILNKIEMNFDDYAELAFKHLNPYRDSPYISQLKNWQNKLM